MKTIFKIEDGREKFYQWDLNRRICVEDDSIKEVHFCNSYSTESLVVEVINGLASIPNILLQQDARISAFAFTGDYTRYAASFKVVSKAKPQDYVYTETEIKRWDKLEEQVLEALDNTGYYVPSVGDDGVLSWQRSKSSLPEASSAYIKGDKGDTYNVPELVKNVMSSATQVLKNIIPIAKEVLKNIPVAISEISPEAGEAMQHLIDFAAQAWPKLKQAVSDTFSVISGTFNFISEHKTLLTAIAAVLGTIVTAIGLYNTVQGIKNALDLASTATLAQVNTALAAHAIALAGALAPYIAIVAAIGAVIAIIVLCVKHWDEIKEACGKAWEFIKEKTSAAVEAVKNKFNDMKEAVSNKVDSIKQSVSEKFTAVKETMGTIMGAAKDTVKEKLDNIKKAYDEHGGGLKGAAAAVMEGVKGYYSTGYTFINKLTDGKLGEVVDKFKAKMNGAKEVVTSSLNAIKEKFSELLNKARIYRGLSSKFLCY